MPPAPVDVPAAWVFQVDPHELDLPDAFASGDAVLHFEVDDASLDVLRPGQVAHLWVRDRRDDRVPAGIYATGSVVGPVAWVDDGDDHYPVVEVGLEPLADPIDGLALLADDAFVGSPLHASGEDTVPNPVALDRAQAGAVAVGSLEPGPLSPVLEVVAGDEGVTLPGLEVRLPDDTLLVVDGVGHDGWTVVHGSPDLTELEELPDRHRTFMDAVEYVAAVADQAAEGLPVVDLDEGIEAVAIFDADGGVFLVVKEGSERYSFCWLEDDGTLEHLAAFATLKEAILLPVLDQALFGAD